MNTSNLSLLLMKMFALSMLTVSCSTQQCKGDLATGKVTRPIQTLKTVRVAKPDGSLQCQGKGVDVETMQKELKDISVISSASLSDGRLRIQLCGKPTGQFNVYEIEERDLQEALKLGFKEWKPE